VSELIGVLGGAFDPIHYGHLLLASEAKAQLKLTRVIFVPTFKSPHRTKSIPTPFETRCTMVRKALAGYHDFEMTEIEKGFSGPSFSVQTLRSLKESNSGKDLVFIVGADNLEQMNSWFQPEELFQLATVAVACRPGHGVDGSVYQGKIRMIKMPQVDISARDLRRRVREGLPIRFQVPPEVERFIDQEGLYRD
jgi:nicotinate-nucleotide adenylyltransferase